MSTLLSREGSVPAVSGHIFAMTRWSVVVRAGMADPQQAQAALEQLCGGDERWLCAYAPNSGDLRAWKAPALSEIAAMEETEGRWPKPHE